MNIFNKIKEPCDDIKRKEEYQKDYIERKRKIKRFYNVKSCLENKKEKED